jgi:hypothetical protein
MRLSSMRWRREYWSRWAAWLGVIALGLNALVPVHLAFDLAAAFAPAHHAMADARGGLDRHLLALVCGHQEGGGNSDHNDGRHSGPACPVCAASGTLAGIALPVGAMLPLPIAVAAPLDAAPAAASPHGAFAAAYRSRAPPFA